MIGEWFSVFQGNPTTKSVLFRDQKQTFLNVWKKLLNNSKLLINSQLWNNSFEQEKLSSVISEDTPWPKTNSSSPLSAFILMYSEEQLDEIIHRDATLTPTSDGLMLTHCYSDQVSCNPSLIVLTILCSAGFNIYSALHHFQQCSAKHNVHLYITFRKM